MVKVARWLTSLPGVGRLRSARLARAADRYWSDAFAEGGVRTWMAEQACRRYINEQISGSANEWPMEWFKRCFGAQGFGLGLSIGCGQGALERDVRSKGLCQRMVGIDISEAALSLARAAAAEAGIDGIEYRQADFNTMELPPGGYEIVFVHQAMHHVSRLEHCLQQIAATLTPNGLLYLDEYIGPSRTDWNERLLERANAVFTALPAGIRHCERLPRPIEQHDPSEAIRSAEILPELERRFEIVSRGDYGGNLLALILPCLRWQEIDPAQRAELLERLISDERALLAEGLPSYYTVVVARPR